MAISAKPIDRKIDNFISGAKPKDKKLVPLRVDLTAEQHQAIQELLSPNGIKIMSQHKWLQRAIQNQIVADQNKGGIL
jgi:hypothetical protein